VIGSSRSSRLTACSSAPAPLTILRDVRAGVPPDPLEKVLDIARHFEVTDTLTPRVDATRKMIDLATRR
jgi:hypothetical protein